MICANWSTESISEMSGFVKENKWLTPDSNSDSNWGKRCLLQGSQHNITSTSKSKTRGPICNFEVCHLAAVVWISSNRGSTTGAFWLVKFTSAEADWRRKRAELASSPTQRSKLCQDNPKNLFEDLYSKLFFNLELLLRSIRKFLKVCRQSRI